MPTILYAEDDVEHRTMMRVIVKTANITLIEAGDGAEALYQIRSQRPDLVLLDLFMPKMDGFGVMEAVQADPNLKYIPIIVLSAWPTGDNRERARQAGAVDFVSKPYDPVQLIGLIQKNLPRRPGLGRQLHELGIGPE